uniref:Uncharacterized protein LOC102804047 n=1 Tax=Saccoglossus kowalevskii TaxID=10224 RepID=A0ABM0M8E0_SACKO|nr:PREDICTED: uncharacterized protein LOC102804047 [Saccoglossus kowalevskii]
MMNSYRQKMDQILRMGCTYAPRCLPSLIQNKLKQLSEKDQETNEIFLVVDYGSVPVLQEINEMLEPLLHSTAYDMFLACPDIQNMVKEIKAEVCERVTLESSRKEFTIRASQIPELDSAEPLDF